MAKECISWINLGQKFTGLLAEVLFADGGVNSPAVVPALFVVVAAECPCCEYLSGCNFCCVASVVSVQCVVMMMFWSMFFFFVLFDEVRSDDDALVIVFFLVWFR